jgi:uncharacterized protein
LIFREITLGDMPMFKRYKNTCSDYVFSYLFMYKDIYKLKISENDGAMIICSDMAETDFYMPLGDIKHGIKSILGYCKENSIRPVFSKIPEGYQEIFNDMNFHIEEDRDSFDYMYKNSDFIEYSGKEFRKQRNNYHSYLKSFTPEFKDDLRGYIDECKAFTLKHHNLPYIVDPTIRMLDNIDKLSLKGGVVLNQGVITAFCLYEKISDDMLLSHVELTDNSHRGVHAYLVNELAKKMGERYINKEDDMGLPGLRRFKEAFNPDYMLKKYKAYFKQ